MGRASSSVAWEHYATTRGRRLNRSPGSASRSPRLGQDVKEIWDLPPALEQGFRAPKGLVAVVTNTKWLQHPRTSRSEAKHELHIGGLTTKWPDRHI